MNYPPALQAVVDELGRFPGVGPKSAQRIAFWLMRQPDEDVARSAEGLGHLGCHDDAPARQSGHDHVVVTQVLQLQAQSPAGL